MRGSEREREALETGALLLTRRVMHKGTGRGVMLLAVLTAAALLAGGLSLAFAEVGDAEREGELARAVSFVEGMAAESEVIAVFLGLGEIPAEEVDAAEDEILRRAEEYIREHNARGGA